MKTISLILRLNSMLIFLAVISLYTLANDKQSQQLNPTEKQLQIMDKNEDGRISSDEFYGPDELFIELDSDISGFLSINELETWEKKRIKRRGTEKGKRNPEKMLARMDKNSDDRISLDEFPGPSKRFTKIDTDSDGFLSLDELENISKLKGKHSSRGGRSFGKRGF